MNLWRILYYVKP